MIKIGDKEPKGEIKHGSSKYGNGLYSDNKNCQVAQLDDLESPYAFGWHEFPKGTFKEINRDL